RETLAPVSEGGGETTHLSALDSAGNQIALTQSIQSLFGAKVANQRYGFFYNNYLTTCPRRRRHPNRIGSGAPARSNVIPLIADDGAGRTVLAGAAGSRRIVSATVHALTGVLDRGLSLSAAVAAPRVHALLSGDIWVEAPAATPALLELLRFEVRNVVVQRPLGYRMGAVQAASIEPSGNMDAAADPRRDGLCGPLEAVAR